MGPRPVVSSVRVFLRDPNQVTGDKCNMYLSSGISAYFFNMIAVSETEIAYLRKMVQTLIFTKVTPTFDMVFELVGSR